MTTTGVVYFLVIYGVLKMAIGKEIGNVPMPHNDQKNMEACKYFSRRPFFDNEHVIGRPWRIYYTWNMKMGKCMDLVFKNATKEIIQRIWSDMNEYLEQQPNWSAATLVLSVGGSNNVVLLFADQGPAGSFIGVPCVPHDITPLRRTMPLLKFQMKLIRNGKYLVILDCLMGVASLSARPSKIAPSLSEISHAAEEALLGEGFPACTKEKRREDSIV